MQPITTGHIDDNLKADLLGFQFTIDFVNDGLKRIQMIVNAEYVVYTFDVLELGMWAPVIDADEYADLELCVAAYNAWDSETLSA